MKKYINAELQVVSVNNNDIVTASPMGFDPSASINSENSIGAADRFRDFEDYSY